MSIYGAAKQSSGNQSFRLLQSLWDRIRAEEGKRSFGWWICLDDTSFIKEVHHTKLQVLLRQRPKGLGLFL